MVTGFGSVVSSAVSNCGVPDLGAESVFERVRTQTVSENGYFVGNLKRVWAYIKVV